MSKKLNAVSLGAPVPPYRGIGESAACRGRAGRGAPKMRMLVRGGILETVGAGHSQRITADSLARELERRRKAEMFRTKKRQSCKIVSEFQQRTYRQRKHSRARWRRMIFRLPNLSSVYAAQKRTSVARFEGRGDGRHQ